jgi:myo-inositol 2-dehydrogenase / D-chiro-inositol 1-dehydrogenase
MKTSESALSKPVRVGLIGAGRIGTAHAEILARRVPSARLIAIADPHPDAAEAIAAPLGTRAATDPDDLFSDPDIEAVVIAASSTSHSKLILAAIAAGKAVFCEKPMAETLEDADRAIAAAKSAGLPLQVGFNRRGYRPHWCNTSHSRWARAADRAQRCQFVPRCLCGRVSEFRGRRACT